MTNNHTRFRITNRFWITLSSCVVVLLVLAGCADIDALWEEADTAIERADCEAARPPLDALKNNEGSLDEADRARLSILDEACSNLASAIRRLDRDDYALAARYYEHALKSLASQTPLYTDVALQITELYETAPLDALLDHCNAATSDYDYHVYFYEAGLIDEETYIQAEQLCTDMIIDRVLRPNSRFIDAPEFEAVYVAQLAALESLFTADEFAALEVEYEQRLMSVLHEYAVQNNGNATRTKGWLDKAVFLDASLRDDFFVQLAYQKAVTLYEEAVEADSRYGDAVEALQTFIADYPDHALVDDAATLLAEANAALERVASIDDGKIAMFYQNGTPYEVELIFEWNHSDGNFLDKLSVKIPPCEYCTDTSGCIASSPIEEVRLVPQDYVYTLFIARSGVMPSFGPITIDAPGFMCISLTDDWLSGSGLFD